MEADFVTIRDDLQRLQKSAAAKKKVFGAQSHGFRVHAPLSEETVREFETRHRIALPADYREFLLRVGNGGAGPFYGLFKLGEMDDGFEYAPWAEGDGFVGVLRQSFPHAGPWNDLSEPPDYDESRGNDSKSEEEYDRQYKAWERVYWNPANINGAIPICHLGCAFRQWLVVTGREAGNVWDDLRADQGGLKPVRQPGRDRVTFLQWYRSWLDEALQQLR
jgi:hypothetical protein